MADATDNPQERIDRMIAEIPDWRQATFKAVRRAFLAADPAVIEEWKWMGSPVWSLDGMIAVANAFKTKVNVTFAHGAGLADADKLFNGGFGGAARRTIDYFEADKVDEKRLTALVREAIAYNRAHLKKNAPAKPRARRG